MAGEAPEAMSVVLVLDANTRSIGERILRANGPVEVSHDDLYAMAMFIDECAEAADAGAVVYVPGPVTNTGVTAEIRRLLDADTALNAQKLAVLATGGEYPAFNDEHAKLAPLVEAFSSALTVLRKTYEEEFPHG